jgi:mono/diheme cytochrome c family protein
MPTARRAIGRMLSGLAALASLGADALASPTHDYVLHCMGCHGATAEGVPGKVPPLAHTLIQFMRSPAGRHYVLRVPGASNSTLTDSQLAEVLNWIATRFGGEQPSAPVAPFTAPEVAAQRHVPMASVQATRREVVKELAATGSAPSDDY